MLSTRTSVQVWGFVHVCSNFWVWAPSAHAGHSLSESIWNRNDQRIQWYVQEKGALGRDLLGSTDMITDKAGRMERECWEWAAWRPGKADFSPISTIQWKPLTASNMVSSTLSMIRLELSPRGIMWPCMARSMSCVAVLGPWCFIKFYNRISWCHINLIKFPRRKHITTAYPCRRDCLTIPCVVPRRGIMSVAKQYGQDWSVRLCMALQKPV